AREVTDNRRKHLRRVRGFARRIGKTQNPLAVHVAYGEQNDAADNETENRAERSAAAEPVVHQHEPAGADHRAERQREIIVQPKFASELRRRVQAHEILRKKLRRLLLRSKRGSSTARADAFAQSEREEKASARFGRNDRLLRSRSERGLITGRREVRRGDS